MPTPEEIRHAVEAEREFASQLFDELRAGSVDGEGVTRDTYGAGEQFAHALVSKRAAAMGLTITGDHAANLYMTLPGSDPSLPQIMMGSHLDSVANGGNFDGAAGVLAGLVATRAVQALGLKPRMSLTTMGIRAEESVWFQVSYIGSRSAFGVLPDGALDARRVDTGRTLAEHMAECGASVADLKARTAHLDARNIRAFVEVHIEQAPQLVEAGLPVAIGTGVPGNFRYPAIRIIGSYDHVGLPRRFRHDAVLAASDLARGLDDLWQANETAGRPMAFTIGRFSTNPKEHALTKVPGEMTLSLDVRAYDKAHLAQLEKETLALAETIARERRVTFEFGERASAEPAPSHPHIFAGLTRAAGELAIPTTPLASPASHDTATFTVEGVPSCMLFVRNANGSHNPREAMEIDDFMQAAAILTQWLVREIETSNM